MTVGELIELLEDLPADAEVRLAQQPNWAFEYTIGGISRSSEPEYNDGREEPDEDEVVWICEGRQIGYAPEAAFGNMEEV